MSSSTTRQVGGSHYLTMKIQPFEFSMANELNPMQHTIVKYVARYREKGGLVDLEKAKHTLEMLIEWEEAQLAESSRFRRGDD